MPEITTRLGPLRLTWDIEYTTDGTSIIAVFAVLLSLGWEDSEKVLSRWVWRSTRDGCCRQSTAELSFFESVEEKYADGVAASDKAREAIERLRADLRREDAERFSRP